MSAAVRNSGAQAPATDTHPKITSVGVFPQSASAASLTSTQQDFLLEIDGTGFADIDMTKVNLVLLPAPGGAASPIPALSGSLDHSKILVKFSAPANYAVQEIALSTGSDLLSFNVGALSCDFTSKVKLVPPMVPKDQAGNKYGNGVAKNFFVIQISIVNECPMAIVVPLGGISVAAAESPSDKDPEECRENGTLVAFSLDHVTSIYSADRKLTGRRAIYFNVIQAAATIGSAIEPFFASGFTKGVAILGGGFTTASKEIFVDMSAEQLQNLTSQSFGSTEQVAAHGSLQKFVFVRRSEKCRKGTTEKDIRNGNFSVNWELSPASSDAPKTLNAPATKTTNTGSTK